MAIRHGAVEDMALNLFGGTYANRRVLVTGHTGFKGSWLCLWLRELGARVTGLALAPETIPAHWSLLHLGDIRDLRVDLRDSTAVRKALLDIRPEIVFHLAAQALVPRSYRKPQQTFDTNVLGIVHLFEAVRQCTSVRALVNATTDKVYLEHPTQNGYSESDALGGHDPYSTSKACSELITESYRKSYFGPAVDAGTRVATARAGNVIGGGDWAEDRLVPDLVRAATAGHPLMVRNPAAIRPWQHVLEPLSGYLLLGQRLWDDPALAGAWNFGPGTDGDLDVQTISARLGMHWPSLHIEHDQSEHPHEAATLRLNCDKARQRLAWRPVWDIDTALARTAIWYRKFHESGRIGSAADLADYVGDAKRQGLEWAA